MEPEGVEPSTSRAAWRVLRGVTQLPGTRRRCTRLLVLRPQMETVGVEPTASSLQARRSATRASSPQWEDRAAASRRTVRPTSTAIRLCSSASITA
jgi:hypothetical protein